MREPALIRLARFVAEDTFTPDARTIEILRQGVIDTLGCIHAGSRTDLALKTRKAARSMGTGGPARVIATDLWTSRPQAAFLNAVAGHALDFDDWEVPGNTHPTVVMLPALLAVAGEGASGRDLAHAYVAGFEVIARLGEALNFEHYNRGWHSTATLGAIGAAAAVARLLGCNEDQVANAMSLAISTASGYTCQFGSNAKPIQAGFAARAGVEAASLAAAGLTAQPHILDHARGMDALMAGAGGARINKVLDRLGAPLALSEHGLVLKPWPSCGYTHRAMSCALRLRERVNPDRIVSIDLHLPDFHAAVLPFSLPRSRSEALFSLPFVVAMGLANGGLTIADIDEAPWQLPEIIRLIALSKVHPYCPKRPELNYADEDPDRVVITLSDGSSLEECCAYPVGAPQAPMSDSQLWTKFGENVGLHSADWIERLRCWPDCDRICSLLTEKGPVQ